MVIDLSHIGTAFVPGLQVIIVSIISIVGIVVGLGPLTAIALQTVCHHGKGKSIRSGGAAVVEHNFGRERNLAIDIHLRL